MNLAILSLKNSLMAIQDFSYRLPYVNIRHIHEYKISHEQSLGKSPSLKYYVSKLGAGGKNLGIYADIILERFLIHIHKCNRNYPTEKYYFDVLLRILILLTTNKQYREYIINLFSWTCLMSNTKSHVWNNPDTSEIK